MATKTVFLTGAVYFVPSDFDPSGPWALGGIGAGGGGRRGNSQSGSGGGGGAFAQITNADASLVAGRVIFLSIGAAGTGATVVNTNGNAGTDTWANLSGTNSAPGSTAAGFLAKAGAGGTGPAGGAGGLASASIGSTKNSGGSGGGGSNGTARGGGGGGGAGGLYGAGGTGGTTGLSAGGGSGGGGSGGGGSGTGGANGGSSTGASGTAGGANSAGTGAGSASGGNGSAGGGGGGADAAATPGAGGLGGAGADWTQTSNGAQAGPGGGGGGGGNATGSNSGGNGGVGGGYGAGGGGCGGSTSGTNAAGLGGNGAAGFAYFTYTVLASASTSGRSPSPFTLNFGVGGGLGFAPGNVGIALGGTRPTVAFSPDQISGLVFAIRPDSGVTVNAGSVVGAAPAWNTTVGAYGSGSNAPTQAAAFGPGGQDLFQFASASTQYFSLASDVTVGACTVLWMYAPTVFDANKQLFANAASSSFFRSLTGGANSITTMAVKTEGGAATNISLASGVRPYRNMLPAAMTYDPAASSGTVNIYLNNILSGTTTGVGAGGFIFNRIGVVGASTNPYDGYMGPVLIYNRVLAVQEMAQIFNYLVAWRGQNLYVSTSGDNASVTPWNRTTPLASLSTAAALPFIGYETIAMKGGDTFRLTTQANSLSAGLSSDVRMSWNGSVWGTGKAKVYGSTAPNVSLVSGTVYDCGAFASKPMYYVHYIPGGTIAFGANYTLGNMQRLTEDTTTPATPAVGKWGYSGGHVYVNAGVALSNGDIEVTLATSLVSVKGSGANWILRNFIVAFSAGTCLGTNYDNQLIDGVECYFSGADGIDSTGPISGYQVTGCVVAYMGSGPAGTGSSAGDAYSAHQQTIGTYSRSQAWWCDKGGFDHIGDCTVSHDRCISVSSLPFRISSGTGGGLTVTNSLAVVPANAFSDDGITAGSATDLVVAENNTIVSLKGTGAGVNQVLAGGSITLVNNIITGFATGFAWRSGGALWAGYNDYYANSVNYSGTSAASHDIAVNPQFVSAASLNYVLAATSPCIGAGIFINGVTVDLAGTPRPVPPAIGAYE